MKSVFETLFFVAIIGGFIVGVLRGLFGRN